MIVDDDPFMLAAIEKFLRTKGLSVLAIGKPEEAFDKAQTVMPDLIISDVAMPGIDGFTLLRAFQQNKKTQHIPLVLLTGTDKIADVEKGYASGAKAYILKPVDWERAWAKLEPLLSKAR